MNKNKVLVIGLDGATWDLLNPWIKQGKLPNLTKIIKKGASGVLESTVPSFTIPAWSSAITGVNPGKHGLFDLFKMENFNHEVVSSQDRKSSTIFKILSNYNITSCALNIPGTMPPEEIKGAMISGMLTPSIESNFTYPEILKEELLGKDYKLSPNYKIIRYLALKNKEKLIEILNQFAKMRTDALLYLIKKFNPTFSMIVFRTTDIMQHYLYSKEDGKQKEKNNEYMLKHYQKIDELIGKIISKISSNTTIFIISDHGFSPLKKYFYLNQWLKERKLLQEKTDFKNRFKIKILNIFVNILEKISNLPIPFKDYFLIKIFSWNKGDFVFSKISGIDFNKSKAYCPSYTSQSIIINKKNLGNSNDNYEEIRNEIIEKICRIKDPEVGEKIVDKVYKKEDIYEGENVKNAPDLLVEMKKGYIITCGFNKKRNFIDYPRSQLGIKSGDHRPEGIFIAYGPGVQNNIKINDGKIYDITPTVLHILGISIPDYIDGKVLRNIFTEGSKFYKKEISYYTSIEKEKDKIKKNIDKLKQSGKI